MSKSLNFYNLTGGLNTVQTLATINSTPNRTESPDMVNVEYFKLGGIKTMNGNVGLNKLNQITQPLRDTEVYNKINFGYEYVLGNNHYMIVADKKGLFCYTPYGSDTFEHLIDFDNAGDGATICGYSNGIVASHPNNNYLIYYKRNRNIDENGERIGLATVDAVNDNTTLTVVSYGGTQTCTADIVHIGDLILINDTKYEVMSTNEYYMPDGETINPDKDKFTINSAITLAEDTEIYLSDFTKIYLNYVSKVKKGDTVVTTTTAFTAKVIQSHQGRLWIGAKLEGQDTASYVIYSDLGNIYNAFEGGDATFYDAGYFEEFYEDTSDITAIGTWDKYVVVHKREHTYLINTSNSDTNEWNVESYSEYTCDNQAGFVKANNGYYTYCSSVGGIYPMIQRTIYSAISQGTEASYKIRDSFLNLNTYALDEIFAVYHPYKKYIMFYLPMIGENGSNNCYILDLQTKTWLHRRIPQMVSTAFEFDNKVYVGTIDGKIYEEFRGDSFDGEAISFSWKSPWFIWGGGTNKTTSKEMRVKMSQEGTNNFFIRNRRDGHEDYKERNITNTSGQVASLVWDNGTLTDEEDIDYIDALPVYSYTVGTETYYALTDTLSNTTWMYKEIPTTFHIANGNPCGSIFTRTQVNTLAEADYVEWGTDTAYAFTHTPTIPKYICYQSTKDSNIKAWITRGTTNKAIVNVKDTYPITYYAFYGVDYNRQRNGRILAVTQEYVKAITNGTTKTNIPFYIKEGNTWTHEITLGGKQVEIFSSRKYPYGLYAGYGVCGRHSGVDFLFYSGSWASNTFESLKLERATAYDSKGSTPTEVWNGKSTRSGKTKNVSYYSDSYITIDGVRFNRYTAGDEGTVPDPDAQKTTYYGKTEKLIKGQEVYKDTNFDTQIGTVASVSGTNYTIDGRIFIPDPSRNEGTGTKYYATTQLFPEGMTGTPVVGKYAHAFYSYPDDAMGNNVKVLTDSKWDESTWVNTGQLTKRFLIDRQYFETLQIEFCGETIEQGMELYGFEIEGIQLTETPWQ